LLIGAGLGALAGAFAPGGVLFVLIGALGGGSVGKLVAPHISVIEWDPSLNRRPYVGANSPDDDGAS